MLGVSGQLRLLGDPVDTDLVEDVRLTPGQELL